MSSSLLLCGVSIMIWTMTSASEEIPVRPMHAEQLAWKEVTVAAVQMAGARGEDTEAIQNTVTAVIESIQRAASEGVQLIVFPETLLGKVSVDHPEIQRLLHAVGQHHIYVIIGCYEILDEEERYANNALLIDRQGVIIGRYAKVHPAVGEPPAFWPPRPDDIEWLMEKGDSFPVFDLDFGRIGILICYDGYFPETYRTLALRGAEILVWMNDRLGSVEDYHVKSAIAHNYVHMITTNWSHGAGTMIAQWPVQICAQIATPEPGYITHRLPLEHLRHVRKHPREYRQRRPEVYHDIVRCVPLWEQYEMMDVLSEIP